MKTAENARGNRGIKGVANNIIIPALQKVWVLRAQAPPTPLVTPQTFLTPQCLVGEQKEGGKDPIQVLDSAKLPAPKGLHSRKHHKGGIREREEEGMQTWEEHAISLSVIYENGIELLQQEQSTSK